VRLAYRGVGAAGQKRAARGGPLCSSASTGEATRMPDEPGFGVEIDRDLIEERRSGHTTIDG
jgi:hypothetical protein